MSKKSKRALNTTPRLGEIAPNGYKRCCMNCEYHKHCDDEISFSSIKRFKEWCGKFMPDYGKIDRVNLGRLGGRHGLRNPDKINIFEYATEMEQVGKDIDEVLSTVESTLG